MSNSDGGNAIIDYAQVLQWSFTRRHANFRNNWKQVCCDRNHDFSTCHDIDIATIVCNDMLAIYINKKVLSLDSVGDRTCCVQKTTLAPFKWTDTKNSLVELGYAIHTKGSLNSGNADIKEIMTYLEKKRAIKQGAMQTLLEPKEDWAEVTLGKCGRLYGGLSGKSKKDFIDGNKPYIPFVNVMKNIIIDDKILGFVHIANHESQNTIHQFDLIFNGSSETPEELGLCSAVMSNHKKLYLNSFCFCYRLFDFDTLNPLYLAYFCRSARGRNIFQLLAQGATRYNLSKANFKKIKFLAPTTDVQESISKTLSDMDEDINTVEKRIAKVRTIKEGMAHQLLTGAIRLI